MKRPFAAIGAGIFAAGAFLYDKSDRVIALAAVIFCVCLLIGLLSTRLRKIKAVAVFFMAALICSILIFCSNQLYYEPLCALSGQWHTVSGQFTGKEEISYSKYYYELKIKEIDGERVNAKMHFITFTSLGDTAYCDFFGNVKLDIKGNDEDIISHYKSLGIFLKGYSKKGEYEVIENDSFSFGKLLYNLKEKFRQRVYSLYYYDCASLINALVLGDKDSLRDEVYSAFKGSGVVHIICVSGMHLSIWSALFLFIFKKAGLNIKWASLLSIAPVFAYMLLTGLTPSVLRSGIMMIIMLLGNFISRRADSLNSLGAAITVMAVINPYSMGNVSLQLSALSTLGLCILAQYEKNFKAPMLSGIKKKVYKPIKYILSALITTLFAVIFTMPVAVSVFGYFNLTAFISNLLVVFAAQVCMISGSVGALVSVILPKSYNIPAFFASISADYLLFITKKLSGIDSLTVYTDKNDWFLLLAVWALIASLCFGALGKAKKKFKIAAVAIAFVWTLLMI